MGSHAGGSEPTLDARMRAGIRDIPDFPSPGILFRDITPLLGDGALFRDVTAAMAAPFADTDVTHVAGIESRGFVLAAPVAQSLGAGFIPIRKQGKLPWKRVGREYGLEYGTDRLEIHEDACPGDCRVLIVDDVLATGGTARASAELVRMVGGTVVGFSFLIALGALGGESRLAPDRVDVLLRY
ncbi:MAG TPA: adenine phosphoribosyltransferase [Gemmatimonadaceae bacterium]|nr:adenine phosphoribosyltransferase [Gemmatimonadaceae bacterium]